MTDDNTAVLDAALGVFIRYGFKRSTMGDIAKAAGLSRQSLYARFANKDEVYAAGLELYGTRIIDKLETQWAKAGTLGDAMDAVFAISLLPTFQMLRENPDAADMVEAAASPEGRAAMIKTTALKCAALARLFEPYADALKTHGLTPVQLAEFVETNKMAMIDSARDRAHLDMLAATLKASVLALAGAT